MNRQVSVLFVCLGNICRSPLAEGAFRAAAGKAGLPVEVDSAGTGNWHVGKPPDVRAQATALRHGVDISGLRARQLARADFTRFSHIFALDHDNLSTIKSRAGTNSIARISLFLDMVAGWEGQEVADPYYGNDADFEQTWKEVDRAAHALVAHFNANISPE